jgi:hypothetical protein
MLASSPLTGKRPEPEDKFRNHPAGMGDAAKSRIREVSWTVSRSNGVGGASA